MIEKKLEGKYQSDLYSQCVVDVCDVSFSYIKKNDVLSNINLKLKRGDFLALMGPNGSGKSTLVKLILGLHQPSKGSIKLFGQLAQKKIKQHWRIGYLGQHAIRFNPAFPATVREVVSTGLCGKLGLFRSLYRHDWQKVDEILAQVGLSEVRSSSIGYLSGGQQQRMLLARSLVAEPELLILDEPTVGIDSKSTAQFYELLTNLNRINHLTLLIVTHDIGVISSGVKNIACLNKSLFFHGRRDDFSDHKEDLISKTYGYTVKIVHHNHTRG